MVKQRFILEPLVLPTLVSPPPAQGGPLMSTGAKIVFREAAKLNRTTICTAVLLTVWRHETPVCDSNPVIPNVSIGTPQKSISLSHCLWQSGTKRGSAQEACGIDQLCGGRQRAYSQSACLLSSVQYNNSGSIYTHNTKH